MRYDYYPNKTSINYAEGFRVEYHKSFKVVEVLDTEDLKKVLHRYYLVEQGTKVPDLAKENEIIRVPLASLSCLSTTQVSYLARLGFSNIISGVGHADMINDSALLDQIANGWTMEITRSGQLDKERVLEANTNVLMANEFDYLSVSSIESLGIPCIYTTEYLENSALARAEWIKFFALFFNAEEKADQIFNLIEKNYVEVLKLTQELSSKPTVMFGSYYQGSWYVPGGLSLVSKLIEDAGAHYVYRDQETKKNVHIDSESLMERMNSINWWGFILSKEGNPVESDFLAGDDRMLQLAKEKQLSYFFSNSQSTDYFGAANLDADVLLLDLSKIFHPALFPQHQFVYFKPY